MAGLSFVIGASTAGLLRGLKTARGAMTRTAKAGARMGAALGAAGGAAGLALGGSSLKTFGNFEAAMSGVLAVSGATKREFEGMNISAKMLGESTRFTATEVAGLQLAYSKLGFSAGEILKVTEGTLALAVASGSDLARAAEVAGGSLRGFGLEAKEMGRVTDVMAKSFSSSALDVEKFAESMKFLAPVAKASNVSYEESSAMLAVLADNMVSGSMAGTSLRRIMTALAGSGKPFAAALQDLADKGLTLTDANDEVGRTAQTSLLILANNMDKIKGLTKTYEESGGAAKEMAGIMDANLKGSMVRLGSAWEGFKISLGESLAPIGHGLIDGFQAAISTVKVLKVAFSQGALPGMMKDGLILAGKNLVNVIYKGFIGAVSFLFNGMKMIPEVISAALSMLGDQVFWNGVARMAEGVGQVLANTIIRALDLLSDEEMAKKEESAAISMKQGSLWFQFASKRAGLGDSLDNALNEAKAGFRSKQGDEYNLLDTSEQAKALTGAWKAAAGVLEEEKALQKAKLEGIMSEKDAAAVKADAAAKVAKSDGVLGGVKKGFVSSMARLGGAALGGVKSNMDKERNGLLKEIVRNTAGGKVAVWG